MPEQVQQSKNYSVTKKGECPYVRKVIYQDKDIEVVKVTWPPGVYSCAHDHGKSHGLIRVLKGKIFQKIWDKKTKKYICTTKHSKNSILFEEPDLVHVMGNDSKKAEAVTLHTYTPKLHMKKYNLE